METTDGIGAPVAEEGRQKKVRPIHDVVYHGQKKIVEQDLDQLPGGEKPARLNKVLLPSQHLVGKKYSDDNGYTSPDGKRRAPAPALARRPLASNAAALSLNKAR